MWRGLPAALVALAIASPASASSGSITDVAPVTDGIFTATFRATSDRCDAGGDCGWFAFATTTEPADACAPASVDAARVYTGASHPAPGSDEAVGTAFYPDTEGPFRLCLFIARGGGAEAVAEYVYTPPAPVARPPSRLSRRDAEYTARLYLGRRFGAWQGRTLRFRLSCRRIDAFSFRCRASWRRDGDRYRGTLRVQAVSGSELRVRGAIRKRG